MEKVRGNRHAQTGGRTHQCLADTTGHLQRIAHAAHHHGEEHFDQAEYRAEQTEQWGYERDGAERVEEPLEPMHDMAAGVLDAFLDDLARTIAHAQRAGEDFAQRRIVAKRLDVFRIEFARARPLQHFGAQPFRDHRAAPQRPESFQNDGQRNRRTQQDGHHRPAARDQNFKHALTPAHRVVAESYQPSRKCWRDRRGVNAAVRAIPRGRGSAARSPARNDPGDDHSSHACDRARHRRVDQLAAQDAMVRLAAAGPRRRVCIPIPDCDEW